MRLYHTFTVLEPPCKNEQADHRLGRNIYSHTSEERLMSRIHREPYIASSIVESQIIPLKKYLSRCCTNVDV